MKRPDLVDLSNGYEGVAQDYIGSRSRDIGAESIAAWTKRLKPGGAVLDIGCGSGIPVSRVLADAGLDLHAMDASPAMVAAFTERFPGVPVECCAAEHSAFFNRTFDGIVAWGVMFLLTPETQASLIASAANALAPGGRFLFTSPWQTGAWADLQTRRTSVSLGRAEYLRLLAASGLNDVTESDDEGGNHYYDAGR